MERLAFAQRRYVQIIPWPVREWQDFPMRDLLIWLADDVCPVAEVYCKRPAFKDLVTWPLRVFIPGAQTSDRKLIEAIDAGLVQSAKFLSAIARQKRVYRHLVATNPPKKLSTYEEVEISGAGIRRTEVKREAVDFLPLETSQIDNLAGRFWTDLVCPQDFFAPTGGWMCRPVPTVQPGDFVVALNPELHSVGDFVTRCLLRRIEILFDLLAAFHGKCLQAVQKVGNSSRFEEGRQTWQGLRRDIMALQKACLTGQNALLRDACITLTQTYAAFGRAPDLAWLGLPAALVEAGAGVIRHRLTHTRSLDMSDRIAAALGDIRGLYEGASLWQSPKEEAIASGGLVLVETSRDVYWESQRIDVDWRKFPVRWKLLWELASKARLQVAVKEHDLYPVSGARSKMATNLERLNSLLPATFRKRIQPVRGERAYLLNLESNRIHLF